MIKRTLWLLLALTLLLAAAAGCSPGATQPAGPDSGEITEPDDAIETEVEPADADAPAALELETDGERAAFTAAQSEESRRWASGDTVNGTPVPGDPFLVGYGILVHDGTTQYQVTVLDGEVVGVFGKSAEPPYIEGSYADFNPTIAPTSARQTEAFEAAKAEIAPLNPNATRGGIEFYVFFYPPIDEAQYPEVALYASPGEGSSPQAIGGAYGWR